MLQAQRLEALIRGKCFRRSTWRLVLAESAPGVALGGLARAKVLQYKHFSGLDREAQGKRLEAWRPESASGVAFLSARVLTPLIGCSTFEKVLILPHLGGPVGRSKPIGFRVSYEVC